MSVRHKWVEQLFSKPPLGRTPLATIANVSMTPALITDSPSKVPGDTHVGAVVRLATGSLTTD